MRTLYLVLTLIAVGNISAAVLLTMLKIEKAAKTPKGIAAACYFVFTILGLYAAKQLFF